MEIWKYGSMEVWKYGKMEILKYRNLPFCELTKMVFSILENVIYLKNINLYASVSQCISLKNTFVQVDYYGVSYT